MQVLVGRYFSTADSYLIILKNDIFNKAIKYNDIFNEAIK